ncbi:MAG: LTA synthase family protein [Streptococcaceae bacterium]|jgi:lipoteichoic acid synthase|nr:LTA synthase family protein [Streptococcaceae bacterium]
MAFISKLKQFINSRCGMYIVFVLLFWIKSIFAYFNDFGLRISGPFQHFILFINPFAAAFLFLGLGLFIKGKKTSYLTMFSVYFLLTFIIFGNVLYYREFSDFITVNTIMSTAVVFGGLSESALEMFNLTDILYWLDIFILIALFAFKKIKMNEIFVKKRVALAMSMFSVMLFSANLSLANMDRPQLLTRTFSHDYIVRYLGLPVFHIYNGVKTHEANQVRAKASEYDLDAVIEFVERTHAAPNPDFFGIAEGKNVILLHLESYQNFLLDFHLEDEEGNLHEVSPFINQLFRHEDTISFENFFHQTRSGKTADAENLIANGLFGLLHGPLFAQMGNRNTFHAVPNILRQKQGYTSAVFHGNEGNFWNRIGTYKRLGYDYFFDARYFDATPENSFMYGLHDEYLFEQSIQYLERMQQPFYTQFILVSHHFPYDKFRNLDDHHFPQATTSDQTINGFFATANYMDQSIEMFFEYLKESGLYDNSIIVLYGDHYGISNMRNPVLASEILGKDTTNWGTYDNTMLQRVPYMIHIPNSGKGHIRQTYGGQVDMAPTLLHLLGIDSAPFLMVGQDLLSDDHQNMAVLRNGNVITPEFTLIGSRDVYLTQTGELLDILPPDIAIYVEGIRIRAREQLAASDEINNGDLLRFYEGSGLEPIHPSMFDFNNIFERMKALEDKLGENSTSLFSQRGGESTVGLWRGRVARLMDEQEEVEE